MRTIIAILILSTSAFAQELFNPANPQRTRVIDTKSIDAPPGALLWKSEKLFEYNSSMEARSDGMLFLGVPTFQTFSSPILSNGVFYFTFAMVTNSYFFAVDKETGKKLAVLRSPDDKLSPPTALDDLVFYGTNSGRVDAFSIADRKLRWTFKDSGHSFGDSEPTVDGEFLYIYAADRGLYSLAAQTGAVKWLYKQSKRVSPPAISGDHVVAVATGGHLVSLDRQTGAVQWEATIPYNGWAVSILDERVFVIFTSGEIRAFALKDGAPLWKAKESGGTGSSLALHKGMIYYAGRGDSVYGIAADTGLGKLKFKTGQSCRAPLVVGDLVYVACDDNKIHTLSANTLSEVWQTKIGGNVLATPLIADGVMYLLQTDGVMYAVK
jgi:outer membrane protein assembly factor BamB